MNRIVSLLVVVLGSVFVLHAQDTNSGAAMAKQARYSECVAESANRAACDQPNTTTDVVAGSLDDGNVFKTAAQSHGDEEVGNYMGKNMSSADRHKEKKTWPDFIYDSQ